MTDWWEPKSGAGSNGNEMIFYVFPSSSTRASKSGSLVSYPEYSLVRGSLILCWDAVGVFYNPSRVSGDR